MLWFLSWYGRRLSSVLRLVSCVLFYSGDAVSRGLQGEERRSGSSTCVYYMDIME